MHEMSVCQGLIKQVVQIAAAQHATRVNKIHLLLGPLSGVEPDLLQAAFQVARLDTLANAAEMLIHPVPITVRCKTCHAETESHLNDLTCSECGDWQTELISGDELLIERIEMKITQ